MADKEETPDTGGDAPEITVAEDIKGDASKTTITDVEDIVDDALATKGGDDKGEKPDKPEKKDGEKKEAQPEKTPELDALNQRLSRLEEDKKNLKIALHKERQGKKATPKEEDAPLTDDQLKKIMEENPDHDTQLRVMRYMATQVAKGAKKDAIDEVQVSTKAKQMNAYLVKRYPALADEASDMRTEVDETKEALGVTDHPYGDYFGTAVRVLENLPDIVKRAYDKGKADSLGEKAETDRKANIKGTGLTPGGKARGGDNGNGLTADQIATAKSMGLKAPYTTYAKLVGKNARSITVEG